MSQRDGWTLEAEAKAGAIGGHVGTHRAEGFASGDTLGGTKDAAHEVPVDTAPVVTPDDAAEPTAVTGPAEPAEPANG
jgi:hypothetical protein